MRLALAELGLEFLVRKREPAQRDPVLAVARHQNGFFFSGYAPDTTVSLSLCFPQGAPLLAGLETQLINGRSTYAMPRAWRRECRVFVEQTSDGELSCREQHSGQMGVARRMWVGGLQDALIRFYPEPGMEDKVTMLQDPAYPFIEGDFLEPRVWSGRFGKHLAVEHVSGELLISW
jgi:hypothetical protein